MSPCSKHIILAHMKFVNDCISLLLLNHDGFAPKNRCTVSRAEETGVWESAIMAQQSKRHQ